MNMPTPNIRNLLFRSLDFAPYMIAVIAIAYVIFTNP